MSPCPRVNSKALPSQVGAAPRAALVASGRVERPRSTAADRGGQPTLIPQPITRLTFSLGPYQLPPMPTGPRVNCSTCLCLFLIHRASEPLTCPPASLACWSTCQPASSLFPRPLLHLCTRLRRSCTFALSSLIPSPPSGPLAHWSTNQLTPPLTSRRSPLAIRPHIHGLDDTDVPVLERRLTITEI